MSASFLFMSFLFVLRGWPAAVRLRFATDRNSQTELAAYDRMVKRFMEKHQGVSVQIEPVSWKDQRTYLISAIASNTVPDLYNSSYVQLLHHAKLGNLLPVDDLIDQIGRQRFYREYLEQGLLQGHYWGVPWASEGTVFWYRKDLFAAKGLKPPETWEQLLQCAKALTEDRDGDGNIDTYGIVVPHGKGGMAHKFFIAFLASNGGALFDRNLQPTLNSRETAETLSYLRELARYSPPDSSQFDFGETLMTFVLGKSAMTFYFGRVLAKVAESNPGLLDKIGAFRIKKKNYISHIVVENMVIPKGTKYPQIAKQFIRYFLSDRSYLDLLLSVPGHFYPTLRDIAESQEYLSHPMFTSRPDILSVLRSGHRTGNYEQYEYPGVPNPKMDTVVNTHITQDVLQRVLIKGESPSDSVKWGQKRMEDVLKEAEKTEG